MTLSSMSKLALILCLLLVPLSQARAQGEPQKIGFDTSDGVKIGGTFYPSNKGNKAPCVLILHDFDAKGGSSQTNEWISLATTLQKEGYSVLTFDFRGYEKSKEVNPMVFWKVPHNQGFRGAKSPKPPEKIDHKDFALQPLYYRQLVNDVAAAKAYLDNENDSGTLNSRNLIVIGAGQGATVGLMWMAAEFKRHRGVTVVEPSSGLVAVPTPTRLEDETAGADLVAGIWLSFSPTLGGKAVPPIRTWLQEVGRTNKLPMAFINGNEKHDPANNLSIGYLRAIYPQYERGKPIKDKNLQFTAELTIKANLTASKLLQEGSETDTNIVKYLANLNSARTAAQWKKRNNKDNYFFWKSPLGGPPLLAWIKGEEVPQSLPFGVIGLQ